MKKAPDTYDEMIEQVTEAMDTLMAFHGAVTEDKKESGIEHKATNMIAHKGDNKTGKSKYFHIFIKEVTKHEAQVIADDSELGDAKTEQPASEVIGKPTSVSKDITK